MRTQIRLRRAFKFYFLKLKLHHLLAPLAGFFFHMHYMTRWSRWCDENQRIGFRRVHPPAPTNDERYELYEHLLREEGLGEPIDYLEFGVYRGDAIRWWAEHNTEPGSRFIGFDTFEGLPDRWGTHAAGAFDVGRATPDIDDPRCRFEVGLFQDSLGPFLERFERRNRAVVHMDADLYSSTLYVLTTLLPRLEPGDVIMFDEFGVPTHEFRAFLDLVDSYRVKYEVLGAANNYLQLAIRLSA